MDTAGGPSAAETNGVEGASGSGDRVSPPSHFAFSTRDIAPEGRFETWRDLWMRRLFELDMSTDRPDRFEADIGMWSAGPLAIARGEATNAIYERTASFARNGADDFVFTFSLESDGHISSTKTGVAQVPRNGAFFLVNDRSYTVAATSEHLRFCFLRVDRTTLIELMPRDFEPAIRTFTPGSKALDLIKGTVPLLTSKTEPMTAEQRAAIGQHVVDLVALMLNPSRDGRAQIERRGLRAARMGAVLRAIDSQFGDPRLSAEAVGLALGVTGRQVHRLLEETTKTFYEHLLERRLQHAHELLTNPANGTGAKIVDIAFRSGFTDISHFNHAFRARFGDTPTGVRAAATTERTMRHLRQSLTRQ